MQTLKSILYVDDDPDICEVVKLTLDRLGGWEVRTACSGSGAIEAAVASQPDLIIMDVMMPELDGPSTLRRMRQHAQISGIPVVFMTAKVLPAEIANFIELGAIGVIGKPFDPARLSKDVAMLWDKRSGDTRTTVDAVVDPRICSKVDVLAKMFLARTRSAVPRLEILIGGAVTGDRPSLRQVEELCHSIQGAGAMFGFPDISRLSRDIERLVDGTSECIVGTAETDHATAQPLRRLLGQLVEAIERAEIDSEESPAPLLH